MIKDNYPAWEGAVQGIVINRQNVGQYLSLCVGVTELPIIQDDSTGEMWSTLGSYNALIIVDQDGILRERIEPVAFPDSVDQIETVVNSLLQ